MKNNLPKKYNEGIFSGIRNFFLKIFGKKTNTINESVVNSQVIKPKEIKDKNSIDIMKEENRKAKEREQVLNQIEKNLSLIDNWPVEKLLKLEKVYDEKIEQYDSEITRLKVKKA